MLRLPMISMLTVLALHAQTHKVIFDLQTGDEATLRSKLINNVELLQSYYAKRGDTLEVAVVVSGDAYRFFIRDLDNSPYKDDQALRRTQTKRTELLTRFAKHAVIKMCGKGMQKRRIKPKTLYPFVTPIFNRAQGLINYQNDGYAYIPVH